MFEYRGPWQQRNDRSGTLQKIEVRPVWVDLAVVYTRQPGRPPRHVPDGVDLQSRVPGELLAWHRTTTGEWIGWTCLPVAKGEQVRWVYMYVPASALSPRDDGPGRISS